VRLVTIPLTVFAACFGQPHDPASPAKVVPLYLERFAAKEALWGADDPRLASLARETGQFLLRAGDPAAERFLARALALDEKTHGTVHEQVAEDLELLATARRSEALPLLDRALSIREKLPKPDGVALVSLYRKVGDLLAAAGRMADARRRTTLAVAAAEKWLPPGHPLLASVIVDLGFLHESERQFAEAERHYRRALAIQEKTLGPRHLEVAVTLNNLGGVTGAQGRLAQAEPLLRRALRILESSVGPNHTRTAAAAANLADLLAASGRPTAAIPLWNRAIVIYQQLGDDAAAAVVRQSMQGR